MSKELNKAMELLREIRPSIPKDVLELWCKDRDAFLASHPASVEQAGGDERVIGWRERILAAHPNSDPGFWPDALLVEHMAAEIADLRAALAQPSPVRSSLLINGYQLRAALEFIAPDGTAKQLESEARIEWRQQDADFLEAGLYAWCAEYPEEGCVLLDEEPATAQPSPKCATCNDRGHVCLDWEAGAWEECPDCAQAEAERPEVVARVVHSNPVVLDQCAPLNANDELMTVAQHERIVGALRFERQQMDRAFTACINERDAALARVAELEAKLAELERQEPSGWLAYYFGGKRNGRIYGSPCNTKDEIDRYIQHVERSDDSISLQGKPFYAAPVALAQQLHDMDKQCRDDVARALGLRPSQERGFAWSYLLASIKSCVKASEDAAQAQHSVPDGYRLIRLERFAAIKAQLNPEQVDAYRGRNIYDEDKVYANWNACRSALDEIKDVFQQIDWDAENELAEILAAAPGKEGL